MTARSEATVGRIVAAARELFTQRNYADVTIDDIAKACKLTKGAVYHHFSSKENLYREMMRRDLGSKEALFGKAIEDGGSVRSCLRRLTAAFFDLPAEAQTLSRLVRRDINIFRGKTRRELVEVYQSSLPNHVERVLERGMETGEVASSDARVLAWSYVALVEVLLSQHAGRAYPDVNDKLDSIEQLFFGGCAA